MSLRGKILASFFVVILTFSGLYLVMSFAATDVIFGRYEFYVQKQITEQLQRITVSYYAKNGHSWDGIDEYLQPFMPPKALKRTMVLLDENGRPVAVWPKGVQAVRPESVENHRGSWVPVFSGDKQIGTLWLPAGHPMGIEGIRSRVSSSLIHTFLVSMLASLVIAFTISYLLAGRISKPLNRLAQAAQQVGRRRFDLRLPVTSGDEVGVVVRAFNEMSEELHRSEQARRNLVADVAHELRTPLTIIQGQLESIQQGVLPASVETVLPIHDEVIRLNRLVDDLRQLTLAESGRLPLNIIPTDITRLVKKIVDNFQLEAEARGIKIETYFPPDPVSVSVDSDRITQVVVNIIGNALGYTPAGKRVTVGITEYDSPAAAVDLAAWCNGINRPGGEELPGTSGRASISAGNYGAIVWVADQGPGIAPEHLPFVFDRFYRADESRDRGTGGIGLGLAIAREFVVAHGGKITACNSSEGGSVFAFYLPGASKQQFLIS
jgi:two-component system sensor histidine kinase BaeS